MEAGITAGATSAGVYNALLGGKDNYAADRAAAAAAIEVTPLVRDAARANRAFLGRAVTWAARQGIGQFLDLGCGYSPLTRETARDVTAGALVAYVDTDPVVACHARALEAWPGVTAYQADLRDADAILRECEDDGWDLGEPTAVILGLVAQYMTAGEFRQVTARYVSRLAPGSAVIVSTWATAGDEMAARLAGTHPAELHVHSAEDMAAFLGGLEVVEPGITRAALWRPARPAGTGSRAVHILAGAGVKPRVPGPR